MKPFATVQDITDLWRPLTKEEIDRAEKLIEVVSDSLRVEAKKVGKDLDKMVEVTEENPTENLPFANVVKSVTVDIVARALMTPTDQEPISQMSQSALGYSVQYSPLIPGGGLFVKRSELARLGLRKQRYGVIDFYG